MSDDEEEEEEGDNNGGDNVHNNDREDFDEEEGAENNHEDGGHEDDDLKRDWLKLSEFKSRESFNRAFSNKWLSRVRIFVVLYKDCFRE